MSWKVLARGAVLCVVIGQACYGGGRNRATGGSGGAGGSGVCNGSVTQVTCRCADDSSGVATCYGGVLGACMCEGIGGSSGTGGLGGTGGTAGTGGGGTGGLAGAGGAFVAECVPGQFEACTCSVDDGYRVCHPPGTFGECACGTIFPNGEDLPGGAGGMGGLGGDGGGGGAAGSCTNPEPEWCDAVDNDCDGVVDNGYVCADDKVRFIQVAERGAYLQGTTSEAACGFDALQQFWPTLSDSYYEGFDCYAERYLFRRSDDDIYYFVTGTGIHNDDSISGNDSLVTTPPCGGLVGSTFDFDALNQLYYVCTNTVTLRRGNGELLANGVSGIAGVLDDGRVVGVRDAPYPLNSQFAVYDSGGNVLSSFPQVDEIVGTVTVNAQAAFVAGNRAYLSLTRTYGQTSYEVMVVQVDEDSSFRLVRRAPVDSLGINVLATPDGTVLVRDYDVDSTLEEMITAYLIDGSQHVVWLEADAVSVRAYVGDQLLPGPLQ